MTQDPAEKSFPRSFLKLLVAGFLLVALPLAAALMYSAWNTERLAEQAQNAVFNAAQAARASRSLVNRISSIERVAQQYLVLADPELMADYARIRKSFQQVAGELFRLQLDAEQLAALNRTIDQEQQLFELLTATPRAGLNAAQVGKRAGDLAETAYAVLAISYVIADREVERLRMASEGVRERMVMVLFVTISIALATALVLTRVIARPIRQLDAAIRQLGSADFSRPIRVSGPDDLQDLGERLDWLRRRLTELEAQRNRFLRHISHELKTPLTALREGAELLHDEVGGTLAPQQKMVVSILRDNSVRLQRMIEELLDYQRALHAAATLERQPVALELLLREVAAAHQLQAQAKHQTVALDVPPASIDADGEKLRTVFDNLVGNALKFTPEGGRISLVLKEEPETVRVEVIDTGPGVSADERRSIFDTFFRGRAKGGGRVEGSGLGLAIAREFVQAHGGTIGVASDGPGSRFSVVLPRHAGGAV
jgi:two-component system, NtrC family, sensor histidine kinase GlrK